jgi:hypothetical protein
MPDQENRLTADDCRAETALPAMKKTPVPAKKFLLGQELVITKQSKFISCGATRLGRVASAHSLRTNIRIIC